MHYKKFTIHNFKGIDGPICVDVEKYPFLPIIGLNESGKSTILEAIFAFDSFNDTEYEGRHLHNVHNIWALGSSDPVVTAEVSVEPGELSKAIKDAGLEQEFNDSPGDIDPSTFTGALSISRNIATQEYNSTPSIINDEASNQSLLRNLMKRLPYITLIDDRAGLFPASIQVAGSKDSYHSEWLGIIDQVFVRAEVNRSVFDLESMDALTVRDVFERVNRSLNEVLAEEWHALKLKYARSLSIELSYVLGRSTPTGPNSKYVGNYIDITVREQDSRSHPHRLSLDARSRGFWWFFTYAMRIRFSQRSSLVGSGKELLLLDEPASYLHSSAQQEWCKSFRGLSNNKIIIYTTHSQFMLDPQVVSPRVIHVAERGIDGEIELQSFYEHANGIPHQRQSLQPAMEALEIRPYMLQLAPGERVVITEGIYDYYSFEMFKGNRRFTVFPATGATNIEHHIPYMIAWSVDFLAVWDHDDEGIGAYERASEHFGEVVAGERFRTLPVDKPDEKRKLENLWETDELDSLRKQLNLAANKSFEKVVMAVFYADDRDTLLADFASVTSKNFDTALQNLGLSRSPV